MKRNLAALTEKVFDLVIVGGGITGACIARDAAMRGLSVALLDKADFASATSSASSKLIHGGLRYLQNFEIGLVRESLRERRIWSHIAPHMVYPLTFLMPTTGRKRIRGRIKLAVGLMAYDWLAYDRNRLEDPEKAIPSHKHLSREEVIALEPDLESEDLSGAMMFHDYQMYSPERLAVECIQSAAALGACVANYAEVVQFLREEDRIAGVRARDHASGIGDFVVHGRMTVNAAGPWADILMATLSDGHQGRQLIRSKGIHILTRPLTHGNAIAVPFDGGHFFILPWRGHSLIGTTDTIFKGDPDAFHVTEKDILEFIDIINKGYPAAKLKRDDVLHFYGGLRPIVDTGAPEEDTEDDEGPDSYNASRAAEVYDHEAQEHIRGIITAIGGKWTTARSVAEQVVSLTTQKLGLPETPCVTATTPTYGGDVGLYGPFVETVIARYPALPPETAENLARNYGSRLPDVVALLDAEPALAERLCQRFPDIAAEVVYAVREEMALTLEDVLFRRTGLGTLGSPGDEAIGKVADIMSRELGWSKTGRTAQIERAAARFLPSSRTRAIVNPHSMGDRTGANWPTTLAKLTTVLGPVDYVFTDGPMAAKHLTRQALKDGVDQIIAVGGDGTVNEVVNGFFEKGELINPDAVLAVIASGTGGDFRRTFLLPESVDAQIARFAQGEIRRIDVGKLTYRDDSTGEEMVRYFDNIASFGLSGEADRVVNRLGLSKRLGGRLAFQWGMFKAMFTYRRQRVRLRVDEAFDQVVNITTVAVANGKYFGGGMKVAPNAQPDDGLFDVIIIADVGPVELLVKSRSVYKGKHLRYNKVTALRGRKITALPVRGAAPVLLDVDGEAPGRLPATFEILPKAICLRC
ncbi:MAG: FAD-dependent oxidoreductase [Candidatus Hydrogenedentes bacterium]|nr:FAD-dependent oxidoreductase [Candidatus Hydrogenedentota bacterium]